MSIWHETEERFASLEPARRWLVTLGTALAVAALGYYGWIEPLQNEAALKREACENLEARIAAVDLRRIGAALKKTRDERLALEERLQETRAALRYLQSRARSLDFLWFEQKSFLEMLDRVLKRSVELGLRIDLVETRKAEGRVSPLIEKKRIVRIEGAGRFADIVRLTHYIESFNALLKVERLRVYLDEKEKTAFEMELLGYGGRP